MTDLRAPSIDRVTGALDRELTAIMDGIAGVLLRDAGRPRNELQAACWASELISVIQSWQLADGDAEQIFLPALEQAFERNGLRKRAGCCAR